MMVLTETDETAYKSNPVLQILTYTSALPRALWEIHITKWYKLYPEAVKYSKNCVQTGLLTYAHI